LYFRYNIVLGVAATHHQRKERCILLRLTRLTWLCLGILVATLLASLGPVTTTPARAAARTPAPAPPSATIRHSHLPPRSFVPAPLRQAGNDTVVRFHGRRILIPTRARLIPALHALLVGAHTSGPSAPRGRIAPLHIQQRHIGLSMPRAPRALATSSAAPSPPPIVSIDAVQGRFFPNPTDSGGFTTPTAPPLFTAQFPTVDFNPPVSAQVPVATAPG
jgi:hypothetical protein